MTDNLPLGYSSLVEMRQEYVIPMINFILDAGDINLVANKNGICNGLAAVYVKYALDGKRDEFVNLIEAINKEGKAASLGQESEPLPEGITESKINSFIQEVLNAYLPQEFNKKLCQDDGVQNLKVQVPQATEGQEGEVTTTLQPMKLQKVYNLPLVAKREHWGFIFNKMAVPNTAWTIATPTHTVAVSVTENGAFEYYNPNNKKFELLTHDAKNSAGRKLANLLSGDAFPTEAGALETMPLTINVMAHPSTTIKFEFPTHEKIIDYLCKKDSDYMHANVDMGENAPFDQLTMAAMQNEVEMIKEWFRKGATDARMAFKIAARDNRIEAINCLLEDDFREFLNDDDGDPVVTLMAACKLALQAGRLEAFERLIQDDVILSKIIAGITHAEHGVSYQRLLLSGVAASNNPECVTKVLTLLGKHVSKDTIAKTIQTQDILRIAKEAEHPVCLAILTNFSKNPASFLEKPLQSSDNEEKVYPATNQEIKKYVLKLPTLSEILRKILNFFKNLIITPRTEADKLTATVKEATALFSFKKHRPGWMQQVDEKNQDNNTDEEDQVAPGNAP